MSSHLKGPFGSKGARFAGYLIDLSLIYFSELVGACLGTVVASFMTGPGADRRIAEGAAANGMMLGWFFWGFVAWFLNYVIVQGMTGSSLGKLAFGLRVVNEDGSPISVGKALARTVCYIASTLPFYAGFLAIFWSREQRCWHDLLCGTVVIRKGVQYPVRAELPASAAPASELSDVA